MSNKSENANEAEAEEYVKAFSGILGGVWFLIKKAFPLFVACAVLSAIMGLAMFINYLLGLSDGFIMLWFIILMIIGLPLIFVIPEIIIPYFKDRKSRPLYCTKRLQHVLHSRKGDIG